MEAAITSEKLLYLYATTRRENPDDSHYIHDSLRTLYLTVVINFAPLRVFLSLQILVNEI
jgi:hypothetical protein